ncbi:MAG: sigma-70 family RNA polymerase sigma factor [Pseudomonadota bacterium]
MPDTDLPDLIRRIASGDRAAFEQFYAATVPKLFGVAMRILRDRDQSADAVQEAYLQLWRNADQFDARKGMIEHWMVSIVRFRAIDIARRERTRHDYFDDAPFDDPAETSGVESAALSHEDALTLQDCLKRIGVDQRRALLDAHFRGFTSEELAALYKIPLGTIKSRIRRGLMSLRVCMERAV